MGEPIRETRVTRGYLASIPAEARRALGIEPGDALVWEREEDHLVVHVKKAQRRGFADFRPFDIGEATDAASEHDMVF